MVQQIENLAQKQFSSRRDSSQYLESITTPQKPHYLKPLSARSARQSQNSNGNEDLQNCFTPEKTPQKQSDFLCLPSASRQNVRLRASIGSENLARAFDDDLSERSLSQNSTSSVQLPPLRKVLRQKQQKTSFQCKIDSLRENIRQTIKEGNVEVKDLLAIHCEKVRAEKEEQKVLHEEAVIKDHESTSRGASVSSQRALQVIERSDEILERDDAYKQVKNTLENMDKITQQKLKVIADEEEKKKRALQAIQDRKNRIEARRRVIGGGHLFRMNFAKDPNLVSPRSSLQKNQIKGFKTASRSLSNQRFAPKIQQTSATQDEVEPWMKLDETRKELYLRRRKEMEDRMAILEAIRNYNGEDNS